MMLPYIEENVKNVQATVAECAKSAGRKEPPLLVAAVKYAVPGEIEALAAAGITAFGENRVQQYRDHFPLLPENAGRHFIGTLQKNKVKYIAESVTLIHSVDSAELAAEIGRQAVKYGRSIPVLLEVNSGREEGKSGIFPEEVGRVLEAVLSIEGVTVKGFMTMGPKLQTADEYRPYFAATRELAEKLFAAYNLAGKPLLSMGMSESFTAAVAEGADIIRVGRRFFAGRPET